MNSRSARRFVIVILFLIAAVSGALLRTNSPAGSTARDVGTLLMLLWLPIVGNIISWLVARVRRRPQLPPDPFAGRDGFSPHLEVELTLRSLQVPAQDRALTEGEYRCALVVENQAYSARWQVPAGERLRRGAAHVTQIEFLAPQLALSHFPPEAAFRMLVDGDFIGDGKVLAAGAAG